MHKAIATAFLALAAGASAAPQWQSWNAQWSAWPWGPKCLNDTGVSYLVEQYTYLLQSPQGADFDATAEAILSDEFCVLSDSIDTLANRTLGVSPYPSKQFFISGQAHTPPLPSVQTLGTFHDCTHIAWRWNATGLGPNEVVGIITMDVNPSTLQIDTVYSEFNTGAWLQNFAHHG